MKLLAILAASLALALAGCDRNQNAGSGSSGSSSSYKSPSSPSSGASGSSTPSKNGSSTSK